MSAYILRRILFMIPTLLGVMILNFAIVQAAPGGPVERMISPLTSLTSSDATSRVSGAGGSVGGLSMLASAPITGSIRALFAGESAEALAVLTDRESAFAAALAHELAPVSVH